jgi:ABC-type polysaccharide/polyol phosphate export permease
LIQVATAVVLRELRVQRRYPISMINLVLLTPLYQLALPTLLLGSAFLVNGSAVGLARMAGTTDLAGWLGLGVLAASLLVGAVVSVTSTLDADRTTGVLENSWASPAPREAYVIGGVVTGTVFTAAASAILLAFAITVLGASYDPLGAAASLPVILAMLAGNCGFGYLAAAALFLMRRADALIEVCTTFAVTFSGVAFPLTLLPAAARLPTYVLPGTWGLDLIRHLTLGTTSLLPVPVELAGLAVTSVAWLTAGRRVFLSAERRVRTAGTLAQF